MNDQPNDRTNGVENFCYSFFQKFVQKIRLLRKKIIVLCTMV